MMLLVAATAIAAIAVGCGGDDDGGGDATAATTVSTSSLTKEQFVKQANAICERERDKILNSETATFEKAVTVDLVPAFESIVDELRALGAPQGDAATIEAYLDAMEEDIGSLEDKRRTISSFEEVEPLFKVSGTLAHKYGISNCAFYSDFSASGT